MAESHTESSTPRARKQMLPPNHLVGMSAILGVVSALAAALRHLIEDGDERRRMGLGAAKDVRRRWLWERLVPDMLDVYGEFLSGA